MSNQADSVSLYKIKKLLSSLSSKRGRGTELVSLYVPPSKALHEVITNLKDEYGTASNIKSDTTRNHVQDALTRTMQRLKLYKEPPKTGIVIFAGAIAGDAPPGSEPIEVYEIIPHETVQTYLYRCDDHFHLEHLREMIREKKAIGILSIDASETGIGIVSGDRVDVIKVLTSGVAGKHRAGGQSARRFERMREMELTGYYHRIADHAKKIFLDDYAVQGLIVGGPGPTKSNFLKEEYLDYRLQNNVLAVLDTSYAGEEGVRETLERSADVLQGVRLMEEKRLVQNFLREVNKSQGLAIYGLKDVEDALLKAAADTVLIVDDIGMTRLRVICKHCGKNEVRIVGRDTYMDEKQKMIGAVCPQCGSPDRVLEENDIIEYFADLGTDSAAKIEVISSKTEEGRMLKSFSGIAAILRYKQ
ncbi:MAG: peptide chain release factor aRF-1 [Thaumarchaeota archaeon]|nr:peptide chain release factor aRF-1 [Nitrososphaerota archaeon]MCL5318142.1 peptide chain release factor aRF-1 [Nitrososphaerota archaeon]